MMKLLIADDEKLIRAGIKKILQDNIETSLEIIEAKNGQEALTICQQSKIDILITDIKMPILDGVELMASLSEKTEIKPSIIVISGFDDFSYAKAAISSGAVNYLLKPVDKNELIVTVNKIINNISSLNKEQFITPDTLLKEKSICINIIGTDCKALVSTNLTNIDYYILKSSNDYISIIINSKDLDFVTQYLYEFSDIIFSLSKQSLPDQTAKDLHTQADTALFNIFFTEQREQCYSYQDSIDMTYYTVIDSRYEQCIAQVELFNLQTLLFQLNSLFDFSQYKNNQKCFILKYLYDKIINNLFSRYSSIASKDTYLYSKQLMIQHIYSCNSISEWKNLISDYLVYVMTILKKNSGGYSYINKALEYINENYTDKNLTMISVANYVSVNYTWFSEKFKEQMGINFNEYLKKIRITQAQRLIETGYYKIYEIADRTGYGTLKNFIKAFKDVSGMKPSEWTKLKKQ